MLEHKRSPVSVDQGNLTSFAPKRHKADLSIPSKERKDKLGEKIVALQQLVSPYGKTDTASVLLETMEYIAFLHEQVKIAAVYNPASSCAGLNDDWGEMLMETYFFKPTSPSTLASSQCPRWQPRNRLEVLSSPYLQSTPAANLQELEPYSLRSKGLCLVPISCTSGVASSNGADIWAPIKTNTPKF